MNKYSDIYKGLIAPCGMNCGICIGYLRTKNSCGGCFKNDHPNKPSHSRSCAIANCEQLTENKSNFCYSCSKFPCARLKKLDTRYRERYGMSMIDNLEFIMLNGIDLFLINESHRWKCQHCGQNLCVHRDHCLNCKTSRT